METINIPKITKLPVGDEGFKLLINQLSIDVMAGIFAPQGKKSERIYKFLNENGTISYTTKESVIKGQEVVKGKRVETSVLKTLV